jgi:DNA integrity scanning protein DisA with diadenylate cyclase activity
MEAKVEKILVTLLRVQSLMNTKGSNDDIDRAIAEIRREIGSNSDHVLSLQITELVEKFAKSSETLLKDLKEMKNLIERLQTTID